MTQAQTAPAADLVLRSPVQGVVLQRLAAAGQALGAGQPAVLLESMKMEVPVAAAHAARLEEWLVDEGEAVADGAPLARLCRLDAGQAPTPASTPAGLAATERSDLAAWRDRVALLADNARPEAVASRQRQGLRMARANIADLLDTGSFSEYGALAVAAQRQRRSEDELQRQTPADGLITGTGTVGGRPVAVMAYDYTVLAGTQGVWNHAKADRLLELCERQGLPLVLWAEGGGGRPGDVDWHGVAGLDCTTFARLAALSGQVPLVGIAAGRCFAGNAALLGCCDLIIAVEGASIGLGGPAMIEGGGLGRVDADAVGPVDDLAACGVIDVRVASEAAAAAVAKAWLALTSGVAVAACEPVADPATLRTLLPPSRAALFDPRTAIDAIVDAGSLIELRRDFGAGLVTAVGRIGGRAVAIAANQPRHLGGALDAAGCDKLANLLQRADAHGLPIVTLVDTPGFMVGPASERTAMVRKAGRLFVTAAHLRVPLLTVVLRRGFGLGAMAMAGGHFHAPLATCAWPSGEFGAMGLEGAVRLGFRKELEAAPGREREALFERLLAQSIERGRALNMASHLEIDEVIDPATTRDWLLRHLAVAGLRALSPRRPFIDPW